MITRRHVIAGAAATFTGSSAQAYLPILGVFARSLVRVGARRLGQNAVRNAVQKGMRRAGRRVPSQPARNIPAELTRGLNMRALQNAPVWRAMSVQNKVDVRISTNFTVSTEIPIVINVVDLDSHEVEESLPYKLSVPFGEFSEMVTVEHPFDQVLVGRKTIIAEASATAGIKVESEPLLLVI